MKLSYLTIEPDDDLTIVRVRAGLFDQMGEMEQEGPKEGDIVNELTSLGYPAGIVLDIRAAGENNHRTLSMVVILIKTLKDFGIRTAVCGTDDFVQIWETCRLGKVSPACTDELAARQLARPVPVETLPKDS
jgi:hypothetical protein